VQRNFKSTHHGEGAPSIPKPYKRRLGEAAKGLRYVFAPVYK
jgi:hypothetical protein